MSDVAQDRERLHAKLSTRMTRSNHSALEARQLYLSMEYLLFHLHKKQEITKIIKLDS